MPYVIRFGDGTYLRRSKTSYRTKRRKVDSIDKATVWMRQCDAKNALRCAAENGGFDEDFGATGHVELMIQKVEPRVLDSLLVRVYRTKNAWRHEYSLQEV